MSQKVLSDLDFGNVARGINHPDPVNPQDVATRAFVLANRTALSVVGRSVNSAGPPADIVSTVDDRLLTRIAGVLAWTQVTLGMLADGLLTNAKLFAMGDGTVKGRALGAGTGAPQDLTGAQVGQLARWTGLESFTLAAGSTYTLTLAATTTHVYITTTGTGDVVIDEIIHGSSNNGARIVVAPNTGSTARLILRYNAGKGGNKIESPGPGSGDYTLEGIRAGVALNHNGFTWGLESRHVSPYGLAPVADNLAVPFTVRIAFSATGVTGTDIDVTVWNAAAPFALRIIDAVLRVTTAAGTAAALRTASGGGGSVVLPDALSATQTVATATAGRKADNAAATATVAAAGSLFLRVDRAVAGELTLTCVRT